MPAKPTAKKPHNVRRGASKVSGKSRAVAPVSPAPAEVNTAPFDFTELGISSSSQEKIETLLACPQRKELPQFPQQSGPGRKCLLYGIVEHSPDQYKRMIQFIRQGVSLNVAATRIDVGERTFYDWGAQGAEDAINELDTYFSRFWRDVRRAIATKASECEQDVAAKNPTRWLALGAGRIFGNKWNERRGQEQSKAGNTPGQPRLGQALAPGASGQFLPPQDIDQVIEGTFAQNPSSLSLPSANGLNDDNSQAVDDGTQSTTQGNSRATLALSPEDEFSALQVLQDIGCISMSPEFERAFQDQLGITEPDKADDQEEGE